MATEFIRLEGGDKMDAALQNILSKMDCGDLSVGFMEGATYEDGTPVAAVAFWNEFGHGGRFPAPARPFFRPMVANEAPTWGGKLAKLVKATGGDGKKALGMLGEDIVSALIQSIFSVTSPPLSKTTLRLRAKFGNKREKIKLNDVLEAQRDVAEGKNIAGGTQANPLVWTGDMSRSVTYKIGNGQQVSVGGWQ